MNRGTLFLVACAVFTAASPVAYAKAQGQVQINVAGTTNLQPLLAQAAKNYMAAHPGVAINVTGTSSGEGIAALKAGSIDVAASDVDARDPDTLIDASIGVVGFAFVTGPNTGVTNLTRAQIVKIFDGTITNWKQVGGNDLPIVPIERQIGAGTRFIFEQTVAKTHIPVKVINNAKDVVAAVATTPGALSYVATYYLKDTKVAPLTYNGVAPTTENIVSGKYEFRGIEHLYTSKTPRAEVSDFVNYVKNAKDLLEAYGVTPL
jgi:phosphate transport system substrate-binding protein